MVQDIQLLIGILFMVYPVKSFAVIQTGFDKVMIEITGVKIRKFAQVVSIEFGKYFLRKIFGIRGLFSIGDGKGFSGINIHQDLEKVKLVFIYIFLLGIDFNLFKNIFYFYGNNGI